eukprot:TRINITY_DN3179_c0_g2_i1.p1 TRINITY_DN3179_c0_g2~~TRINITY_DN3179_c0_g2_i1.p1  ORF type:complete len:850 (+),score=42.44 TRINITY_DN3179_c0_g2_i1:116-2551(+)
MVQFFVPRFLFYLCTKLCWKFQQSVLLASICRYNAIIFHIENYQSSQQTGWQCTNRCQILMMTVYGWQFVQLVVFLVLNFYLSVGQEVDEKLLEVDGCGIIGNINANSSCIKSSFECVGDTQINRICRVKNLLVFDGGIYYITDGENDVNPIPPIEVRLHRKPLISNYKMYRFKRFEKSPIIFGKNEIKQVKTIPQSVIWARNAAGPHVYHNTNDDSSLFYAHICQFYGYCDYDPHNRTDLYVIFSDGYTFQESKSTKQIWNCFTPNDPILPKEATSTLYIVKEAILGVGQYCMHFYHCNPNFGRTGHTWFPWSQRDKWIQTLRQCILKTNGQNEQQTENRITVINREQQYHRAFLNEEKIIQALREQYPDYQVDLVYLENKSLTEQSKNLFTKSKLVVAMNGAALTNIFYMKNCSAVVAIFPYGQTPVPSQRYVEPYIFGNSGLTHHLQHTARIAFMSLYTQHMSQMRLDYDLLNKNDEFHNLTLAEREDFIVKGKCPERHRARCLWYWLHRTADIYVDTTELVKVTDIALESAKQCLGTALSEEMMHNDGRWALSDCGLPSVELLPQWTTSDGRLVSPQPETCCAKDCNAMFGWMVGTALQREKTQSPELCCELCKKNENCSAWNYCPCLQGCGGYEAQTCILKALPEPRLPQNITEGSGLLWLGGTTSEENFFPHWKCGKDQNGSLDCAEDDCHVVQGRLDHPDLVNIQIEVFTPEAQYYDGVSPARCCRLCQENPECDVWNFCNGPVGCLSSNQKAFSCFLNSMPKNVSADDLVVENSGSFTALVSGYVSRTQTTIADSSENRQEQQ